MRVHNWWSLAGAILLVIVLYNFWKRGDVTVQLAKTGSNFVTSTIRALELS